MHPRALVLPLALAALSIARAADAPALLPDWPAITSETKPWSRWWWPGSIVTDKDLTFNLEAYAKAGLGGLELTPIYGVAGQEDKFIPYLSPTWMDRLTFTLRETKRLGLGLDMSTGTGWPFGGGPEIGVEDACKYVAFKTYTVPGGGTLAEPVTYQQQTILRVVGNQVYEMHDILKEPGREPVGTMADPLLRQDVRQMNIGQLVEPISANKNLQALALDQVRFPKQIPLQALIAYSAAGQKLDLTKLVGADGRLNWTAPAGNWTLYAVFEGWHGKMVERAAPGAEGNVIDHFSSAALKDYLAKFDRAYAGRGTLGLRAYFNDSYEVDDSTGQGDWTPEFFAEFQKRRGYDLRNELPALLGKDTADKNARVLSDYRETISDLLLDNFTKEWTAWAHAKGSLTRNQAHGSPGNILDLYAATDIPETEGADLARIKWATSAAHVAGRPLVSAEAATWLKDHFQATLADVRQNVDRYFLGGVNHVVYHGTCYSPADEPWPGFLFYAAVEFNPRNSFWADFGAFNHYVARVQSFLQSGKPANDVLLYFPFADANAAPVPPLAGAAANVPRDPNAPDLLLHYGGGGRQGTESFAAAAELMQARGYTYDFISDRQVLAIAQSPGAALQTGGVNYKTLVVPSCDYMPLATLEKLLALANGGATVIFCPELPKSSAGLDEAARRKFAQLLAGLPFAERDGVRSSPLGRGGIVVGKDLDALLRGAGVARESMVDTGLQFTRRSNADGTVYFIANWGNAPIDGWVPLAAPAAAAALYNPMNDARGYAATRARGNGAEIYLQLLPGDSCVVQTLPAAPSNGAAYAYYRTAAGPRPLAQAPWTLSFIEGGPRLPAEVKISELASWTGLNGDEYKIFSGTARYALGFARPAGDAPAYRIDLGQVRETARVRLNGRDLETLIGPHFQFTIDRSLLRDDNLLEVYVSNSMANRIIDLDKRGVAWKKFYNVNFPASRAENRNAQGLFHADQWDPFPSGLLGPVTIAPLALGKP